jgi:hypothetical protein
MLLINVIFISPTSFYLGFIVLAFFDFSLLSRHFWPFTQVLRRIWPFVTRKNRESLCCRGATVSAAKGKVIAEMQAARLPLQNYFGAREATIFSNRG